MAVAYGRSSVTRDCVENVVAVALIRQPCASGGASVVEADVADAGIASLAAYSGGDVHWRDMWVLASGYDGGK